MHISGSMDNENPIHFFISKKFFDWKVTVTISVIIEGDVLYSDREEIWYLKLF